MEIFIALVVVAAVGYFFWSRKKEDSQPQELSAPYKVEVETPVSEPETKPVEVAPAVTEQPKAEEKPVKKPRATKPKAPKAEAKPKTTKAEVKPKTTKKPKMKIVK